MLGDIALALAVALGTFNVLAALGPVDNNKAAAKAREGAQVTAALVVFALVLVERF